MNAKVFMAVMLVALVVSGAWSMAPSPANAAARRQRIVSTSGIPHADVANYRLSPLWQTGMPKGANRAWRTYLSTTVAQVGAGATHTCVRRTDATARCWGNNVDGQLGDGSLIERNLPVSVTNETGTGPLSGITQLAVGAHVTCVLAPEPFFGQPIGRCVGDNSSASLGDGTRIDRAYPVVVLR